jgi:hypothetical protein
MEELLLSHSMVVRRRTEAKVVRVDSPNEHACSCRPSWGAGQYQQLQGGSVHTLESHLLSIREPESPINTSSQSSSAQLLFDRLAVAEKARCVLNGKQNIYQDGTMGVEIIPMSTAIQNELSGSPEAVHTIKKRHKFSPKDKIYLEQQFSVNPYFSTEDRAQITQRLGISEKNDSNLV